MFYLVGLGLFDEKDISLKGLECLKNVDKIVNSIGYNSIYTFVMKDGTILTKGYDPDYDIGNYDGTEGKNYKNYVVIEGLPNVPNVIKPIEITLDSLNKTEFVVGDTFDYSDINYVNYDTPICIKDLNGNEF